MIDRMVIIGLGLIGGSLGLAVKQRGLCKQVIACGRDPAKLQGAIDRGIVDEVSESWGEAVEGADVVVLATPVSVVEEVLQKIAPQLRPGTIITDVGSTKGSVIAAAQRVFGELPGGFVPGHPIAGTEFSGYEHALADLFVDHKVILTPLAESSPVAVARISRLWRELGAEVIEMSSDDHDKVLAATSHLPHMLAFALVKMLADRDDHQAVFDFAAGGFKDFTRVASSDPSMWRSIALANAKELGDLLIRYQGLLGEMVQRLEDGDGAYLQQLFGDAKTARDTHLVNR
ncbi:MAG: prephenate dehydrogenase/arogenate dehydrogenase family protein, partial [Gammaproteobacteria bacterium]